MQTKTTTKPARKSAPKSAAKTAFSLAAYVVAEIDKRLTVKGETYYTSALAYHAKRATKFPRSDAYKALTKETVDKVFDRHDKRILASGSADGQAVFDMYMLNRKPVK